MLILLRHGQSIWNMLDLFTGWVDIPLSLKGIEEAKQAGIALRGIPIDIAFTSTLMRAQMTLFLALAEAEQKKTPVIIHEKDKIGEWGKIHNDALKKDLIPVYESWQLNERMYGALQGMNKEEMREIWRRAGPYLAAELTWLRPRERALK